MIELLRAYDIDLDGKEVCVLGRGITIGRTIGLLLTRKAVNATVTLCHTGTKDVREHMRRADVIVAAMGVAGFVKPEDTRKGRFSSTSEYPRVRRGIRADTRSRVMSIKPVTRRLWHIRRILEA